MLDSESDGVMTETLEFTIGSDNIFEDLGFDAKEAANLLVRSQLMAELTEFIERTGMTQAGAAERMGVSQPRISELMRGKINLFSIDKLVCMAAHAGLQVTVALAASEVLEA